MGLVGYSDSEGSDNEQQPTAKPVPKASFQKVVDKSKPNKIQVSLPQAATDGTDALDDRPAKKARTSGGFGGFNSFLPAPKNAAAPPKAPVEDATDTKAAATRSSGMGRGVSLKTGATPAFSREQPSAYEADGTPRANAQVNTDASPAQEVKLVGKPMAFKPLSVSRKPKKKASTSKATPNITPASNTSPATRSNAPEAASAPPPKKKTSLFSSATEDTSSLPGPIPAAGQYIPITLEDEEQPSVAAPTDAETIHASQQAQQQAIPSQPNDLSSLATTLNLSAAERRQLFGRNGPTNAQVTQFNLAAEYQSNRALAESGDTAPAHNPVRSIASGKHSLQQLINNAQSQKDALEESFARGKGNKKEAGSRYGW